MRTRALLLLRGAWLGLLIWPYATAGGVPRPLLVALVPPALALLAGPGRLRYALRLVGAAALALYGALPTLAPSALRAALHAQGLHFVAVSATGLLLACTALLGWQVFGEARGSSRLTWLWLMGMLVLALNRRLWGVAAEVPALAYLALGVLLLALGEDRDRVAPGAALVALAPLVGLACLVFWPAQPPGGTGSLASSQVRGVAGLTIAKSGANLARRVSINQAVSLSAAPLLVVRGAPGPSYWQEATFDDFDGTNWREPTGPALPVGPGLLPSPLWPPQTQGLKTATWRVSVQEVTPGDVVPLVYAGTPISLSATAPSPGGSLLQAAHALLLPGAVSYSWQLDVPSATPAQLGSAQALAPSAAPKEDLEVPAALRRELEPLARRLAQGGGGPWALAQRIVTYLGRHETYTPAFTPSPRGDPVGQFLLHTHRGYCDQFSTAFVMLARLDGLPTRWAVGFAPGPWDPVGHVETLRAEDAHSWAEIDVVPYGWLRVDPTPAGAVAPGKGSAGGGAGRSLGQVQRQIAVAGLALLAALALAALIARRRRRALRLGRIEQGIARLARGHLAGRPTWREQVLSLPPPAREAAWPALEVLEAAHYGRQTPSAADLARAEAALRAARRAARSA